MTELRVGGGCFWGPGDVLGPDIGSKPVAAGLAAGCVGIGGSGELPHDAPPFGNAGGAEDRRCGGFVRPNPLKAPLMEDKMLIF